MTVTAFAVGGGRGGGAARRGAGGPVAALACASRTRPGVLAACRGRGDGARLRRAGRRLPGPRRQVDERWLHRYRGWVYGAGFGVQLGLGVATVVTTSAVYVMLAAAVLTGTAAGGRRDRGGIRRRPGGHAPGNGPGA